MPGEPPTTTEATSSGPADGIRKKRVLIIVSSGAIGGGETHALLLVRCLQADRYFEPIVVCHGGGELERVFGRLNVELHVLDLQDLMKIGDVYRLVKLVRRLQPDLVHAHLNRAALWGSFAGWLAKVPVLATAHGMTKTIYYRWASHLIAVSNAVARHFVSQSASLERRMTVVHNGIPTQAALNKERLRQLREQYYIGAEERIVSVIGTLHANKGQEIAIRALKALPATLPVRLFLVGAGPDKSRLEELVGVMSLGPRVTFIPPQPRLFELYALSDFILVPSHQEALSMVVLEALRQARPVIASDTGGIPEIIKNGFNGTLVPPGDSQALAKAIEEGLRNYRHCENMALSGQKTIRENFSIESCYMATRNVYLQVMGVPIA